MTEKMDPPHDRVVEEEDTKGQDRGGCPHYRRRVKFVAPCCGEIFWCRHCHDEVKSRDEPDVEKRHELVRKDIKHVVCALCETRQPVAHSCVSCGVSFGNYSCIKCPFYDDDGERKKTFHCDECGICRVGGREKFYHCKTCGACYDIDLKGKHVCVERALHQNCPVCFEYQFESVEPNTVLKCGHTIHAKCLEELENKQTGIVPTCPICKKSLGDYSHYWELLDREIERTEVPDEYKSWTADISCNDCSAQTRDISFNLIGLKCAHCGSYNTQRLGIKTQSHPAAHS